MTLKEYIKEYVQDQIDNLEAGSLRIVDLKLEALIEWLSKQENEHGT